MGRYHFACSLFTFLSFGIEGAVTCEIAYDEGQTMAGCLSRNILTHSILRVLCILRLGLDLWEIQGVRSPGKQEWDGLDEYKTSELQPPSFRPPRLTHVPCPSVFATFLVSRRFIAFFTADLVLCNKSSRSVFFSSWFNFVSARWTIFEAFFASAAGLGMFSDFRLSFFSATLPAAPLL